MNLKLKSIIAVVLITLLALGWAGCSDNIPTVPQEEPASTATRTTATTPASSTEEQASTAAEEEEAQEAAEQPSQAEADDPEAEEEAVAEEPEEADDEEESVEEAAPEPAPWMPDAPLPFDPSVVRGSLNNGLTYFIKHNTEPQDRAQLSLVVRAGSLFEEEGQRGLAHFLEHMAFNGTERFAKQEIVDYIESIGSSFGAHLNAGTNYDYTVYWLEVPTDDPEILETAFQILSDWAFAISLEAEEIELERGVVLEEWRLSQGFGSRFQTNLYPLLFGDSRYAERDPIGLVEIIETAPVEQFQAFYERWYRPDLMSLVAVGEFDMEEIEAKITQHFAPPPEGEAYQERAAVTEPIDRPSYDVPDNETPIVDVFTDPEAPVTQLTLVRKLAPDNGADLAAFRRGVVEELAFMMLNARLFERGQEADPPWLYSGAGGGTVVEPLAIQTFTILTEQDGVEDGLAAVLEETQRIAQHGFTAAELERESDNLLSTIESRYKQRDQLESSQLASAIRSHILGGPPVAGIEAEWELYQQLLPQITLDEVHEVGASWSESRNTVLLVLGPEGIEIGEDGALAAALRTQLEGADALVVDPYAEEFDDVPLLAAIPTAGSIVEETQIESIDAVQWTLSNGITVIAKQTDFKNDEVQFSAYSPGGHSLVADKDFVSAQYAADLVNGSGAGPHDRVALDRLLAGKRVSVSAYIGELHEGLGGSSSPEDLETLFQLITLFATEASIDPDYFTTYESRLRTSAELRPTQPDAALYDRANTLLTQGHLRGRPLSLEVVEELDFERAAAVFADRFADLGDSTFVFVGAFDWDELRSLTATYLASLPTSGRTEQWQDVDLDPPEGVIDEVVYSGIEPRSQTVWVFAGDAEWSNGDVLALNVAGEMLTTRLRERLREALGGTYFVQVSTRARRLPDEEYQVAIIYGSDPDRVDELVGEVANEIDWLKNGGEQSYLDTVKEQLRTSREEQIRDNGFWLNQIVSLTQLGDSLEEVTTFNERLDALTLEQVAAAAERYLIDDQFVRVVLLPEQE